MNICITWSCDYDKRICKYIYMSPIYLFGFRQNIKSTVSKILHGFKSIMSSCFAILLPFVVGSSWWVQDTLRRVQGQILWRKTQLQDFRLVGFEHHGSLESLQYLRLGWWKASIRWWCEPNGDVRLLFGAAVIFGQQKCLLQLSLEESNKVNIQRDDFLHSGICTQNCRRVIFQKCIKLLMKILTKQPGGWIFILRGFKKQLHGTRTNTYRSLLLNNPWWHCSLLLVQCWESLRELLEPMSP